MSKEARKNYMRAAADKARADRRALELDRASVTAEAIRSSKLSEPVALDEFSREDQSE